MDKSSDRFKIIFVCQGNYCRSPMAEAIFKKMLTEKATLTILMFHLETQKIGMSDSDQIIEPVKSSLTTPYA